MDRQSETSLKANGVLKAPSMHVCVAVLIVQKRFKAQEGFPSSPAELWENLNWSETLGWACFKHVCVCVYESESECVR